MRTFISLVFIFVASVFGLSGCSTAVGGETPQLAEAQASLEASCPRKRPIDAPEPLPEGQHGLPTAATYLVLYCTPDGEDHWLEETSTLTPSGFAPPAQPIATSTPRPATRSVFGGFDPHWGSHDLTIDLRHPSPKLQWVLFVNGEADIYTNGAPDADARHFKQGDFLRLEDTASRGCKGHITVFGREQGLLYFTQEE